MKLVKSLLLGSAAAIAAAAGAQAADLPSRKSAPVKYVQICDAYGAGFFYIPGTDICFKIGDIASARMSYSPGGNYLSVPEPSSVNGWGGAIKGTPTFVPESQINTFGSFIANILTLDARDQSPAGTVRLFALIEFYSYGARYNYSGSTGGSGGAGEYIFPVTSIIQWAGITAGRAPSEYGFYKEANAWGGVMLEPNTYTDLLAYTATFGGGFSATLSVEDAQVLAQNGIGGTYDSYGYVGATYGGEKIPNFIGNLRLDQGWGALQLSGGIQQLNTVATVGNLPFAPAVNAKVSNSAGYGVLAGAQFNLPQLAAGDQLWLEAAYADGALQFAGIGPTDGGFSIDGNSGTPLLNNLQRKDYDAFAYLTSSNTYALQKTQAWMVMGDFLHYWTPQWRSNIYANWIGVDPGSYAEHTSWAAGGLSAGTEYRIGGNIIYSPVAGFDIGVDVMYAKLNQSLTGSGGYWGPSTYPSYLASVAPGGILTTLHLQRAF